MKQTLIRQSFLGPNSDAILDALTVSVVGTGGAGSHVLQQLSHVGVGNLLPIDPDKVEFLNLNRLVGATFRDAQKGQKKTTVSKRVANSINPDLRVRPHSKPWHQVMDVLRDADVIVGCLDTYSGRSQLEAFARRYLIPYLDVGMDVHSVGDHYVISGQVALSMPGDVCLQCMGIITPDDVAKEAYGAAGGRPQVVWPNGLLASAAVGMLIELVTPWFRSESLSLLRRYDGNRQTLEPDGWMSSNLRRECKHYTVAEVGDPHPFWISSKKKRVS